MPKDDINYSFTENGVVYDFYDVFVPGDYFREPSLFVWGANTYVGTENGGLGINTIVSKSTPVTTFAGGTNWKQVSCGRNCTAAIKTDGTLWTWGENAYGQLGINTTVDKSTPVTTFAGGNNWKQVSIGSFHTLAIKTDGTLWTWGAGSNLAALGTNDTTQRNTPVTTFAGGNNWKFVAAGQTDSFAIKTDGTLWTWGRNNSGILGTNDNNISRCTPVTTFTGGNNWKQISPGSTHVAAIKTDGTLWTWGSNSDTVLGIFDAAAAMKCTPVTTFAGGTNWKQVTGGGTNTAAIKTDGTLWTWGRNTFQQLGINAGSNSRCTPVTTFAGGTNWKQVSCGSNLMVAIKTDGTLWTVGINSNGQLGTNDSTFTNKSTPVTTFAGGTNWKQVSSSFLHVAAITYTPDP